jgi:hypothetical protein
MEAAADGLGEPQAVAGITGRGQGCVVLAGAPVGIKTPR